MPEIHELLTQNEKLAREVLAASADRVDREREFPRENLEALGRSGVLGLLIPTQYGGAGGSIAEMSQVVERMGQSCASTAMVVLMHYCGTAVIMAKGSASLKESLLPLIAQGRHLTTLAFSEPGSGGHFYFPVSEVQNVDGEKRLSARKSFVTSAGEADSYVVSARPAWASLPNQVNLYLLSKGTPGFTVEKPFEGMGLAGNASAAMRLAEVPLEDKNLLGEEGSGFQTMLEVVLPHFQIGVASISLGIASAAMERTKEHVLARKYEHAADNPTLAQLPRVQFLIAEMALELRSARAYLEGTIRRIAANDPEAMLDVLGIKARAAEACQSVVSRAMMLGGGKAFGQRGGLERMFRDTQAAAVMAPSADVLKDFLGKACLGLALF
ncbi:MAG: acyl-CoA/acyl-ACP dehydrogenase [Acidobacteria bacterium]|nr:acyl-CoA/acyl-ACP dehydrogenase [Acidobacteriota bacterium]